MDLSTLTVASLTDRYNEMTGKSVKVGSYPKSKLISMIREIEDKFAGDFPIAQPQVDPMHPDNLVPPVGIVAQPVNPLTFEEVPGGVGYPAPAPVSEEELAQMDADRLAEREQDQVAARLEKHECPLCGGDPANQTAAGEEGTFLGDSCNFCHDCGKTYNHITGAEVPTRDTKKRRILNPQAKIDAKEEALAASDLTLTYDRNARLWTVASTRKGEALLWNLTSRQFAEFTPAEIVAEAGRRLRPQA